MDRHTQAFSYDNKPLAACLALIDVLNEWEQEEEVYKGMDILVDVMIETMGDEEVQTYHSPIISTFMTMIDQHLFQVLTTEVLVQQL